METKTLTLSEFLLARIAEDERAARALPFEGYMKTALSGRARRALAECEAKRRLVAWHGATHVCEDNMVFAEDEPQWDEANPSPRPPCGVMTILATVYVDHPDYDGA